MENQGALEEEPSRGAESSEQASQPLVLGWADETADAGGRELAVSGGCWQEQEANRQRILLLRPAGSLQTPCPGSWSLQDLRRQTLAVPSHPGPSLGVTL